MASQPIVFLPGVMGSRLYFKASKRYWDPDRAWRMLGWAPIWPFRSDEDNRFDLHARQPAGVLIDPEDDDVDEDGVALGWGGVVWSFYGEFLGMLREVAEGRRAFAVGYDWRQDIRWLGEYAADKFHAALDATGADRIAVVTHSMGGLVARAAFRHDPELIPRVSRVIHICQPAAGAVILYRRLFTGMVPDLDGDRGIGDRVFRLLLGNSRAGFVGNMSGLPGPLQLAPSAHFPADPEGRAWHASIAGNVTHADLYAHDTSPPGFRDTTLGLRADAAADLGERVLDVAEFHDWLGPVDTPEPARPETWVVCGTGMRTEVRIGFPGNAPTPALTDNGDGTVPALSALAMKVDPNRLLVVQGVEHAKACGHAAVMNFARSVLSA